MGQQKTTRALADAPDSVAAVYEDRTIANSYLEKRLRFSWQTLLHRRQIEILNGVINAVQPESVLEIAPGPARLAVELRGVRRGVMVENSEEMIAIARRRLQDRDLGATWSVVHGDAFVLGQQLSAEQFALAFTFRFIRHFREPERVKLYREIRSRIAPGGFLVLDVVNGVTRSRLDAELKGLPQGEIAIYDAVYSPESFRAEMRANGFEVIELVPMLRHFRLQSFLSYKLDNVARPAVGVVTNFLERIVGGSPLEWVACCRCV